MIRISQARADWIGYFEAVQQPTAGSDVEN
jgi:hypothetical protein